MAQVQTPCPPSHFRWGRTGILPPEKESLLALKTVASLFSWTPKIQKNPTNQNNETKKPTTPGLKTLPNYVRLNRKLVKSPVLSGDSLLSVPLCQRTTDINRTGAWLPQCLKATPMPIHYKSHTSSPTKSLTIGTLWTLCVRRKLWYHSCPKMRYIQFYMMNLWLVDGKEVYQSERYPSMSCAVVEKEARSSSSIRRNLVPWYLG